LLIPRSDQIEFIKAAAIKASLSRAEINKVAAVLWDTVRKAGSIFAETPKGYGNPKLHDVTLPTAKQLGYHSAQQRQRWEICAAAKNQQRDD
jgi:hypothetical protein